MEQDQDSTGNSPEAAEGSLVQVPSAPAAPVAAAGFVRTTAAVSVADGWSRLTEARRTKESGPTPQGFWSDSFLERWLTGFALSLLAARSAQEEVSIPVRWCSFTSKVPNVCNSGTLVFSWVCFVCVCVCVCVCLDYRSVVSMGYTDW